MDGRAIAEYAEMGKLEGEQVSAKLLGFSMKLTLYRYWESKLAPGHVPSEAKIENFIRTKYESKRWVMEGGMPDPSTLGSEGDDDVVCDIPLSSVSALTSPATERRSREG